MLSDVEDKDDSVVDAGYVVSKGETLLVESDTNGEEESSDKLSTVILRCISVTRDQSYQESLLASLLCADDAICYKRKWSGLWITWL